MNSIPTQEDIISCLQTVFDPDFPFVDIWSMWLIYDIKIEANDPSINTDQFSSYQPAGTIDIDMTLTTPNCPAADYLPLMAKNSITSVYPEYEVTIHMVWEPTWTIDMLKDEDLKRMFE